MMATMEAESGARPIDRARLEAFERALDPARPEALPEGAALVGFGEISMVFRLAHDPGRVFKRVAGLGADEVLAYRQVVEAYVARLDAAGVRVAPTELVEVENAAGRPIAYLAQRAVDPATLGPRVARDAGDAALAALLGAILEHADAALRRGAGLDAQLSNWALARPGAQDDLIYLDLTTPMLREGGREVLDLSFMLRSLPLPVRLAMRATRADRAMMDRYYARRTVALDLVSNLVKEDLAARLPAAIEIANRWLRRFGERPLEVAEVRADYRKDARMWAFLHAARRQDRWVRTRLGRGYDWAIAPSIDRRTT